MSIHINEAGRSGLSRRSFLKSAIASGAFGISGMSLLTAGARAAPAASREVLTGCHWGAFHATVKDGRFVAIKPWEKIPYPSPQLPGVMDSVYSPTRMKYPMVRAPGSRGRGPMSAITRQRRLGARELGPGARAGRQGIAADEETYGPAATFTSSSGWKSPASCTTARL